jgi:hypothetical protein
VLVGLLAASCGGVGDAGILDSGGGDAPAFANNPTGCVARSCAASGYTCGQNADGCGNLVACGDCVGNEYCGGGGFSRCGLGDAGVPADAGTCTPTTCVARGLTCGQNADGCGGIVDCGTCTAPAICGAGGFSVCGAPAVADGGAAASSCVPATCASLGAGCGTAGDGCAGVLDCGACVTPAFCGGGGFSLCGGTGSSTTTATPACVPKTCQGLGFNCGPAGDGCGNLLQCGTCSGPDACGGGGTPGVCGHTCTGLCTQQVACTGTPTTLTGRVLAGVSTWVPAGTTPDPVPNAIVYIPSSTVQPFTSGAQCTQCGADVSGDPLVSTTTAYDGTFTLSNVPVGSDIPVVVQLGRWRRQVTVNIPTSCAATAAGDIHLPRTEGEGDVPLTAISTGAVDSIECILLKMGVDETEFDGTGTGGGSGRIHLYSNGFDSADINGHGSGAYLPDSEPETSLLGTGGTYMNYDQIMLPCWGDEFLKTSDKLADLVTYGNGGGRFFATHFSYTWLFQNSPFDQTAVWDVNANRNATANAGLGVPFTGNIDVTGNPNGTVFERWLNLVGALSSTSPPQVTIEAGRHDVDSVLGSSIDWIDGTDPSPPSAAQASMLLHYTFDTPVGQASQCGHAIFSDFHVNNQLSTNDSIFPDECDTSALNAQERILEYMIWDLQSCVPPPPSTTCTPRTCAEQGLACGPAGDGCGNVIQCGTCTAPQTCGGAGVSGQCGAPSSGGGGQCTPETCAAQNISCGSASDGCGNLLDCGTCVPPLSCGGGGVPGQCGASDAGARCAPTTCAAQSIACGFAGDGCGNLIDCGSCPPSSVCGGGGVPGQCGPETCVPETCAEQHLQCGPAGDGCGNVIQCGACVSGTCGAGGFSQCSTPAQ